MFYSWLSVGIAVINKESVIKFLDPGRDADCRENLIDWTLGSALQKI